MVVRTYNVTALYEIAFLFYSYQTGNYNSKNCILVENRWYFSWMVMEEWIFALPMGTRGRMGNKKSQANAHTQGILHFSEKL
jgi:hypothetical protein